MPSIEVQKASQMTSSESIVTINKDSDFYNKLDAEHEQLKNFISKLADKKYNVFDNIKQKFLTLENGGIIKGDFFRQIHDKLGWKAKETLDQGGLCAGAIYRSIKFINIEQGSRNGSKKNGRNIHIEHTVPVKALTDYINQQIENECCAGKLYEWTLRHSICTAVSVVEQKII